MLLFLVVQNVTTTEIITTSRYRLKNLVKEGNNLYLLLLLTAQYSPRLPPHPLLSLSLALVPLHLALSTQAEGLCC